MNMFTVPLILLLILTSTAGALGEDCPNGCLCFENNQFVTCSGIKRFPSFPVNTMTLEINNAKVASIPNGAFRELQNLKLFDVKESEIGAIEEHAFTGLGRIESISIKLCKIDLIKRYAFANLTDMKYLIMSDNVLTRIERFAFSGLKNISEISLYSNKISLISPKAFHGINQTKAFQFYINNVNKVRTNAFSDFQAIGTFNAYLNNISTFECGSFDSAITAAEKSKFNINLFKCDCKIAWMLYSELYRKYLLTNDCLYTRKEERMPMSTMTEQKLSCPPKATSKDKGCSDEGSMVWLTSIVPVTSQSIASGSGATLSDFPVSGMTSSGTFVTDSITSSIYTGSGLTSASGMTSAGNSGLDSTTLPGFTGSGLSSTSGMTSFGSSGLESTTLSEHTSSGLSSPRYSGLDFTKETSTESSSSLDSQSSSGSGGVTSAIGSGTTDEYARGSATLNEYTPSSSSDVSGSGNDISKIDSQTLPLARSTDTMTSAVGQATGSALVIQILLTICFI